MHRSGVNFSSRRVKPPLLHIFPFGFGKTGKTENGGKTGRKIMIREILCYRAQGFCPWDNQALEAFFTEIAEPGRLIFYLWQNDKTVVIGRNQAAFGECRVEQLEADGGFLARRLSGGGAVYHDKENINFTFALHADDYDTVRQTEVILRAVRALGLKPERSGRNDLTLDGRKFSGHSYYKHKDKRFHNGTILVAANTEAMRHYLTVRPEKLQANKVRSVRSRVVNLRELLPSLSVEDLIEPLAEALYDVYGVSPEPFPEEDLDLERLRYWTAFFSAPDWLYGKEETGLVKTEERYSWGGLSLSFNVEDGLIKDLRLYSDGLEGSWLDELRRRWENCPFTADAMLGALERCSEPSEADVRAVTMPENIRALVLRLTAGKNA